MQGLHIEVSRGMLARGALGLVQSTFDTDDKLLREARKTDSEWDGTIAIKGNDGNVVVVREQVVPVANTVGTPSGFNISLWSPLPLEAPSLTDSLDDRVDVDSMLTPRQLEVAGWYANGLTSKKVAIKAGITSGTARAHLEEIYSRLDVHTRAELTALLVREGLV